MEGVILLVAFGFWLSLSVVVGIVARERGRSMPLFFFGSILVSPLFALLLLIALPPVRAAAPESREDVRPLGSRN